MLLSSSELVFCLPASLSSWPGVTFSKGQLEEEWALTYSVGQLLVNRHTAVVLQKRDFLTSVIHPCCSLIYAVSLTDSQGGALSLPCLSKWIPNGTLPSYLSVHLLLLTTTTPALNKYKSAENNRWARCSVTFWNITLAIGSHSRSFPHYTWNMKVMAA